MKPYKCKHCGKVLFEADLKEGTILKICPKCKTRNSFTEHQKKTA